MALLAAKFFVAYLYQKHSISDGENLAKNSGFVAKFLLFLTNKNKSGSCLRTVLARLHILS